MRLFLLVAPTGIPACRQTGNFYVAPKLRLSNQLRERFKKIYELRAFIPVVELPVRGAKVVQLKAG